ncbi:hypothetical protein J7J60_01260 [bacterium]|nr:hypothetical protein [bacterium]
MKQYNLPIIFASIALALCFIQGMSFLVFHQYVVNFILTDAQFKEFLNKGLIEPQWVATSVIFIGCLSLALSCWYALALFSLGTKKAFYHFLIPSILSLLLNSWLVSFLGFLACYFYYKEFKTLNK